MRGALDSLWRNPRAKSVEKCVVKRLGQEVEVCTSKSYYFSHEGVQRRLKEGKQIASRELWKGQVEEIRTIPSKETLLLVRWFWSKEDITDLFDERGADMPDSMQSALDSMAEMELCPGTCLDINPMGSLSCEADVVFFYSDEDSDEESVSYLENQTFVVEYFYRAMFDEMQLTMKGPSLFGCGFEDCVKAWCPDHEEQRYCYDCHKWFHVSCLSLAEGVDQEDVVNSKIEELQAPLPKILLDVAFQPAARGAPRHFHAGNIRFVTKARLLVYNEEHMLEFTQGEKWDGEKWRKRLQRYFGILSKDIGLPNREQLLVSDQPIYLCACRKYI